MLALWGTGLLLTEGASVDDQSLHCRVCDRNLSSIQNADSLNCILDQAGGQ
jgi:hypothetical protein